MCWRAKKFFPGCEYSMVLSWHHPGHLQTGKSGESLLDAILALLETALGFPTGGRVAVRGQDPLTCSPDSLFPSQQQQLSASMSNHVPDLLYVHVMCAPCHYKMSNPELFNIASVGCFLHTTSRNPSSLQINYQGEPLTEFRW